MNGKLINNDIQAPLGITWDETFYATLTPGKYKIRMSVGRGSLPGAIYTKWTKHTSYAKLSVKQASPIALFKLLNYRESTYIYDTNRVNVVASFALSNE